MTILSALNSYTIFYLFVLSLKICDFFLSFPRACVTHIDLCARQANKRGVCELESRNFVALTFFIAYFNGSAARTPVILTEVLFAFGFYMSAMGEYLF